MFCDNHGFLLQALTEELLDAGNVGLHHFCMSALLAPRDLGLTPSEGSASGRLAENVRVSQTGFRVVRL